MNRRSVVRFQLVVLGVLVLGLIARRMWMNVGTGNELAIKDVSPFELHRVAFQVEASVPLEVRAAGSLMSDDPEAPMAATAWIIKKGGMEPVWELRGAEPATVRGTLVRSVEQIRLEPGMYEAYFTSYGHDLHATASPGFLFRLFQRDQEWENDQRHWGLSLVPLERQEAVKLLDVPPVGMDAAENAIWQFSGSRSRTSERFVFEVTEPIRVHVSALGEIGPTGRDFGWIDDLTQRRRIWELSLDNSEPAGGSHLNRRSEVDLTLPPGVYAAGFSTDDTHAPDHWRANPPYNPFAWGMSITADSSMLSFVESFDPWETRTPLLELSRVGTDQHDHIAFAVDSPLDIVIDALGEISTSNQYDYGWIEDAAGQRVWEMRHENSNYAGGDRYNREALEIIRLSPGQYAAHFVTDDSHAYGDWRKRQPRNPERWGMTVFPLNRDLPSDAISVLDRVTSAPAAPPEPPGPPGFPDLSNLPDLSALRDLPQLPDLPSLEAVRRHMPVRIHGVQNGQSMRETLHLNAARELVVVAQGEILPTERYDYAWIERADNGETVWSMTWDNTMPAGGDDRNRLFAGTVELPAGEYVVRYQSDPSHAYGDFGKIAPNNPESWGVSIIIPEP